MGSRITLKKLFDASWQAFVVEERPWSMDGDECVYRDYSGNRCAIGLCLNDEQLRFVDEHQDADISLNASHLPDSWFRGVPKRLRDEVQERLHDYFPNNEIPPGSAEVKKAYLEFAAEHNIRSAPNKGY